MNFNSGDYYFLSVNDGFGKNFVQNAFPRIPGKMFKFFKTRFYSVVFRALDLKLYF